MNIKIKYFTDVEPLKFIGGEKSDWIDLRCAEDVTLKQGEYKLLKLGVGMELPKGYEAHVAPRSSTFKNFGIICANSFGIIDNSYCGDEDEWRFPAKNDRICQFRIIEKQPNVTFEEVEHLKEESRGGIGSSGIK